MTSAAFVGADVCGRRGFRVTCAEEPWRPHRYSGDDWLEFVTSSGDCSSWPDGGAMVGDHLRESGNSNLWTPAPREHAADETWGPPCLSRSRRSVRIRC